MISLLIRARFFILPFYVSLAIGLGLEITLGNESLTLAINLYNSLWLNPLAKTFTLLGDGYFTLVIFAVLLAVRIGWAVSSLIITNLAGLLAQLLKSEVYASFIRPGVFFAHHVPQLHFTPGVRIFMLHTFPSGHTTTAFSVFLFLALYTKNNVIQCLYFILAAGVAWSRIYLAEHFFADVLGGAVLGTFTTLAGVYLLEQSPMPAKTWFIRSVFTK